MDVENAPKLLRPAEVAHVLSVSPARVLELARAGFLPRVRIGRSIRIPAEALTQFIASGGRGWAGGWRKTSRSSGGTEAES